MNGNLRWDGRRVRCDTEKARKIGSFCEGEYAETLYRNKEGAFFLHRIGSKDLCKLGARGKLRPLTEEEAQALGDKIQEKYSGCDVEVQFGGQPVYYYIISAE